METQTHPLCKVNPRGSVLYSFYSSSLEKSDEKLWITFLMDFFKVVLKILPYFCWPHYCQYVVLKTLPYSCWPHYCRYKPGCYWPSRPPLWFNLGDRSTLDEPLSSLLFGSICTASYLLYKGTSEGGLATKMCLLCWAGSCCYCPISFQSLCSAREDRELSASCPLSLDFRAKIGFWQLQMLPTFFFS